MVNGNFVYVFLGFVLGFGRRLVDKIIRKKWPPPVRGNSDTGWAILGRFFDVLLNQQF